MKFSSMIKIGCLFPTVLVLSACGKAPVIPSPFEIIGETVTESGTAIVLRDKGTGCEMIALEGIGIMPRYERSIDGTNVKQRCVLTGDEQPTEDGSPAVSSNVTPSGFQAVPNPVGTDAQEQAVRDAIREQTGTIIPPAGPVIPPPSGSNGSTPVPKGEDGIESQLK